MCTGTSSGACFEALDKSVFMGTSDFISIHLPIITLLFRLCVYFQLQYPNQCYALLMRQSQFRISTELFMVSMDIPKIWYYQCREPLQQILWPTENIWAMLTKTLTFLYTFNHNSCETQIYICQNIALSFCTNVCFGIKTVIWGADLGFECRLGFRL